MWCLFDPTPSGWYKTDAYSMNFASNWLERLLAGSISTCEDLSTRFLAQFFLPGRSEKLCNDILMFQQHQGESLSEAWTYFKDLLQKVPHHGIDLWLQVQIFYDHVNPTTRRTINQSTGGKLRDKNAKESWALLEDLALYDNKSWNDPRDFAKPVKAISLPQDVLSTSDRHLIELENQLKDPAATKEIGSSRNDEEKEVEWIDDEEPLDLIDTSEESVYESLIKEMPRCSLNYDFRIRRGNPRNLKIPCIIRHKFMANAYIDVDLPMNIMSLAYYNSIRKDGYEYRGRNFVGLGRDMHVFVGNMSYIMDFTILENTETNIDPSLSHVLFGRPFVEIACLAINRKHGLMTFMDGIREVTFKTP
ncbi:protein kinase-like domain, concanavalin A-like lectin/glucanase domain protein [Tanacetum coccineum]|uniref:Protein kinase-like domain, concanavalin A-like lectin/glucanase domain protein n=1 Tax=Tanacetum coccineum TaxID=301880 RepID=A0ABQ5EI60_9ASTR